MIHDLREREVPGEGKPRASGDDPRPRTPIFNRLLVNPARAGMIPRYIRRGFGVDGKPRASGDDP